MLTAKAAKVLIVDDDPEVLDLLGTFLVAFGYEVERALHGADALMAVGSSRPDVVLLDFRMDGLDGVEVLKRIRARDASLPVIIVTGHDNPALRRETQELGVQGYLLKPVDPEQLKRAVAGVLTAAPDHIAGHEDEG
jgi:two-component system response regulator GlrR